MLYSQKGAHQSNGNFLTYVQRSEKFLENMIKSPVERKITWPKSKNV